MNKTPIEWTDFSVNPLKLRLPDGTLINACVHKSGGCINCYAEGIVRRWWRKELWGEFPGYTPALLKLGTPVLVEEELQAVLRLSDRIARGKADPEKNKLFWNDMTDEYLEFWPDEFIDRLWAVRALTPNLIHQVLTKRAERVSTYLQEIQNDDKDMQRWANAAPDEYTCAPGYIEDRDWPLPNAHLGVSVEDQKSADERIPWLLKTPAAVRWISYEPALGPVDFTEIELPEEYALSRTVRAHINCLTSQDDEHCLNHHSQVNWVVCGGESGPGARPMHPDWARSVRDQCVAAGVPFFFKQWGEWGETATLGFGDSPHAKTRVFQTGVTETLGGPVSLGIEMRCVGKKAAGRLLDGREWNEMPEAAR